MPVESPPVPDSHGQALLKDPQEPISPAPWEGCSLPFRSSLERMVRPASHSKERRGPIRRGNGGGGWGGKVKGRGGQGRGEGEGTSGEMKEGRTKQSRPIKKGSSAAEIRPAQAPEPLRLESLREDNAMWDM